MRRALKFLFRFDGTVSQRDYLATGVTLAALKYGLDSAMAYADLGSAWGPWTYFSSIFIYSTPPLTRPVMSPLSFNSFLPAVYATALPFAWIALAMTVRRLRAIGLPPWLAWWLVIPIVGPALIAFGCLVRTSPTRPRPQRDSRLELWLGAVLGILAGATVGWAAAIGPHLYGVAIFVATPTFMGIVGGYFANRSQRQSTAANFALTLGILIVTAAGAIAFSIEGAVCIAMAFPLAVLACFVGTLAGRSLTSARGPAMAALLVLPMAGGLEKRDLQGDESSVETAVDMAAPPAVVWRNVITFPDLPPPDDLPSRLGIAYPVRAVIEGRGVGAVRRCEFSTGDFVEPITDWQENVHLAFDVTSSPDPMRELSPFRLHPAHLDGWFRSKRGEFRLIPLPDGGTRLIGRTWYQLDMAPRAYWQLWTDGLIHRIHRQVLEHIRRQSEREVRLPN